jgi:hypothetical protein
VYTFASCISMFLYFSEMYTKVTHAELIQQLHVCHERIHLVYCRNVINCNVTGSAKVLAVIFFTHYCFLNSSFVGNSSSNLHPHECFGLGAWLTCLFCRRYRD